MNSKRLPVTLDVGDIVDLQVFADTSTAEAQALAEWARLHSVSVRSDSEASVLRVLAKAGAEALRERALDVGYAKLALEFDDNDTDEVRERRKRYADRIDQSFPQ